MDTKLSLYFSAFLSLGLTIAGFIGLANINRGILASTSVNLFAVIFSLTGGILGILVSTYLIKR